jgi:hypothetical protein
MTKRTLLLAFLAISLAPDTLAAQLARLPGEQAAEPWLAPDIGARVGFEGPHRHTVLGTMLHVSAVRSGRVAVLPSMDVTFLRGLREYQYNLEAAYFSAARVGGLYLGGGVGFRNTIPPSDPDGGRRTLTTYNVLVGIKLTGLGRVIPMIEFRRAFANDLPVDPQLLALGAMFRLW